MKPPHFQTRVFKLCSACDGCEYSHMKRGQTEDNTLLPVFRCNTHDFEFDYVDMPDNSYCDDFKIAPYDKTI